ncbi:hypothetical protein M3Y96_00473700 [Aphelenchoides besseyi]|nr:hypothetical protein M3Y96_00473700 [Aphelenchoides besseyi]
MLIGDLFVRLFIFSAVNCRTEIFVLFTTTIFLLFVGHATGFSTCAKKKRETPPIKTAPNTSPSTFRFSNIISEVELKNPPVLREKSETYVEPNFGSNESTRNAGTPLAGLPPITGLPPLNPKSQIPEAVTPPVRTMKNEATKPPNEKIEVKPSEINLKKADKSEKKSKRQEVKSQRSTKQQKKQDSKSKRSMRESRNYDVTVATTNVDVAKNSIQLCSTQIQTNQIVAPNEEPQEPKTAAEKMTEKTCPTAKERTERQLKTATDKAPFEAQEPTTSNEIKGDDEKKSKRSVKSHKESKKSKKEKLRKKE